MFLARVINCKKKPLLLPYYKKGCKHDNSVCYLKIMELAMYYFES